MPRQFQRFARAVAAHCRRHAHVGHGRSRDARGRRPPPSCAQGSPSVASVAPSKHLSDAQRMPAAAVAGRPVQACHIARRAIKPRAAPGRYGAGQGRAGHTDGGLGDQGLGPATFPASFGILSVRPACPEPRGSAAPCASGADVRTTRGRRRRVSRPRQHGNPRPSPSRHGRRLARASGQAAPAHLALRAGFRSGEPRQPQDPTP